MTEDAKNRWSNMLFAAAGTVLAAAIIFMVSIIWTLSSEVSNLTKQAEGSRGLPAQVEALSLQIKALEARVAEAGALRYTQADAKRDGDIIDLKMKQLEYRMSVLEQDAKERRARELERRGETRSR